MSMTSENCINFYELTILKFQMFCLHNSGIFKVFNMEGLNVHVFSFIWKKLSFYSDICWKLSFATTVITSILKYSKIENNCFKFSYVLQCVISLGEHKIHFFPLRNITNHFFLFSFLKIKARIYTWKQSACDMQTKKYEHSESWLNRLLQYVSQACFQCL